METRPEEVQDSRGVDPVEGKWWWSCDEGKDSCGWYTNEQRFRIQCHEHVFIKKNTHTIKNGYTVKNGSLL